jgi:hypothetical protein
MSEWHELKPTRTGVKFNWEPTGGPPKLRSSFHGIPVIYDRTLPPGVVQLVEPKTEKVLHTWSILNDKVDEALGLLTLSVRMPAILFDKLYKIADERGMPVQALARMALEDLTKEDPC